MAVESQFQCNAHIVHNTLCKVVVDVLDCDVETIVTANYSHLSISANRRTELQFFKFVDLEYHDMLRHGSTRLVQQLGGYFSLGLH